MATGRDIDYLLGRAIPDALDPIVRAAVGDALPRIGEGGRYRIAHTGRFSSRYAGDLLAFGRNQHLDGALLVIEADTTRALFFRKGRAVGATSDVLFERFGRVLARCEVVDEALTANLVGREETLGLAAAVAEVTPEVAAWALETRVWDIAAALFLVPSGHFVIVEGTRRRSTDLPVDRHLPHRPGPRRDAPVRRVAQRPAQAAARRGREAEARRRCLSPSLGVDVTVEVPARAHGLDRCRRAPRPPARVGVADRERGDARPARDGIPRRFRNGPAVGRREARRPSAREHRRPRDARPPRRPSTVRTRQR